MKPRISNSFASSIICVLTLGCLAAPSAFAADGTWLGTSGNWSDTTTPGGVWASGIVADGAGFTANFTGVDITADQTITLDAPRTIGGIAFTDATTASHNLLISGANILTLDVASGAPLMNVTNRTLTISSEIQGNDGLTKSGAGDLVLSGTNSSFSGPVSINAGVLTLSNVSALGTASGITMANTSILRFSGAAGTFDYDYPISLTSGGATIKSYQGLAQTFNLGGSISGAGGLTFQNESNAAINLNFVLEQPNTYRGNTSVTAIAGGNITVKLGANNALPTTTTLTLNQGSGNNGTNRNSIFDLAGFNQTIAGLVSTDIFQFENSVVRNTAGAATLTINNNSAFRTFTGKIQQTGAGVTLNLVKTGGNTQVLAGNNNYTGTTTVNGGPLTLDFSQFGSSKTDTPANYINSGSVLELGGGTFTVIGRANGSAVASTNWTTPGTSRPDITFTTLPAGIVVGQAITAGTGISGAGSTAYIVGIDAANKRISLNAHPTATSGTFETAATNVTTSQTFASTTLNPGRSGLTINANNGDGTRLVLNAITRNIGGVVNFTQPAGTISATNGFTTTTANTAGTILGGWATVGGTDWATNDGTNIVALGSYTLTSVAGTTSASYAGADIDVDSSAGLPDGVITPNSLRFNTAAANTVTLAAGNNTITSGGILVTSNVGTNASTITGGTLRGASGADLVITQNNTGTAGILTIASIIDDNTTATGLTKAGGGSLALTASNTYTGTTYLNEGSLVVSAADNLGAPAANLVFNGGTLQINGTALTSLSSLGRTVSVIPGKTVGLSIADSTNSFAVDQLLDQTTGGFTKAGTGNLTINLANTYTGTTTISGGTLTLSGSGTLGAGGNLTLSGGQLDLGGSSQTVGAVSVTAAAASGDTILNGSLTGNSYAASNTTGDAIISANLLANGPAGFTKTGAGTATLSGTNTYTGTTTVSNGILKLASANALPGGTAATGGTSGLTINGGVVGLTADFLRARGTGVAQVQWTGSGGFAAYGGDRTVTLGNSAGTAAQWNNGSFVPGGDALVLSAADSDGTLIWQNPINFAGSQRTIQVNDGSAAVDARITGAFSGGSSSGFNKTGSGTLEITSTSSSNSGANTISAGTLRLGASNVLQDTTNITIAAATLEIGAGFTDTAGTLDVTNALSTINLGSGAKLAFAASNGVDWTDSLGTLNITGTFVPGDGTGPGTNPGSLRFGTDNTGLTAGQLSQITATGWTGFGLDAFGYLTATPISGSGFDTWKTTNSATGQTLADDHDGDGVTNGVEYFIGGPNGNTTGFTALPGIVNTGGTLSVTFTKAADYAGVYGTDYVVETSATLSNPWTAQAAAPDPGFTVTFPSATEVKYTFPAGTKNFARLKVTGP